MQDTIAAEPRERFLKIEARETFRERQTPCDATSPAPQQSGVRLRARPRVRRGFRILLPSFPGFSHAQARPRLRSLAAVTESDEFKRAAARRGVGQMRIWL